MKLLKKNQQGFTLVELMVVVAIIGILSAVAVPNFKRYQAKSKQSEAKVALAAVYTVEVTASSDTDTFVSCIKDIGFEQPNQGYYSVGFGGDYAAGLTMYNARMGSAICTTTATNRLVAPVNTIKADSTQTTTLDATYAAVQTTFTAGAVGSISATGGLDIWTINQAKALVNKVNGVK